MTLETALNLFLHCGKLAEATVRQYQFVLGHHVRFLGVGRDVRDVMPGDIDAWADHERRRGLAASSLAMRIRVVRSFWAWVAEREYVSRSPALIHLRRPRLPPLRSCALTASDRARLLQQAQYSPYPVRDYALVRFLADVACRVGALCRVRLRDLDLQGGTALLEEKGDHRIMGYYGRETARALGAWLAVRPAVESDAVFITWMGGSFSTEGVRTVLRRLARAAGVEGRHNPHSFRHLMGMEMAEAGMPLSVIQAKLGHTDPSTTVRYLNQSEDHLRRATETLSARF